jgi:phosphoenolpyruvate---glycerone phosphotransferase subunit DhaL
MQTAQLILAIEAIAKEIYQSEAIIAPLDREIGDGDHYINLKRGCQMMVEMIPQIRNLPIDVALNTLAMKLLSTIGGASGPLFASFLMGMSKQLTKSQDSSMQTLAEAFSAGVDAISARGKASVGEKTMLDVLIPVAKVLHQCATAAKPYKEAAYLIAETAIQNMLATKDMLATKGRAAGLGERARGHIDPGAKSCQIMICAVCNLVN